MKLGLCIRSSLTAVTFDLEMVEGFSPSLGSILRDVSITWGCCVVQQEKF